jgi:membrane dipeptidase
MAEPVSATARFAYPQIAQEWAMQMDWERIFDGESCALHGASVELRGWFVPISTGPIRYGALVEAPDCCGLEVRLRPESTVEVFLEQAVDGGEARMLSVAGRWAEVSDPSSPWRFQLRDARVVEDDAGEPAFRRRRLFLGVAAAAGLVACSAGRFREYTEPPAEAGASPPAPAPVSSGLTIDAHSHAGRVILSSRDTASVQRPFTALAAPMRDGGMNVICLAVVADSTATRVNASGLGFEPYRMPAPGEMYEHSKIAFARCRTLIEEQGLHVIEDAAALRDAPHHGPSVIVASEGADFLEGRIERVDEAWRMHRLRHLQLTHYRVNELGDIQTEPPVHGGLTDFGAEVIARCNALGIVVDIAHGTYSLVERAARVTTRPLVLSHTSLTPSPGPRSRQISAAHARLVAGTGGIVGVWPNAGVFVSLDAMAHGARQLAGVIGAEHVALGSDMLGFIKTPVFNSYRQLPAYASALREAGFTTTEVEKVLGGNYQRVFEATLAGAPVPAGA